MSNIAPPKFLTIAGSDSGGGAGIQADLRTSALLGCHGSSVITALTAQNSLGVTGVFPVPADFVASQLEAVLADIGFGAVKTGMLFNAAIINEVAGVLAKYKVQKLVVDPVMVAKGGSKLLEDSAIAALSAKLFPLALLVTPNIPEAEVLTGLKADGHEAKLAMCQKILGMGAGAVLLKGGHETGETIEDLFVDKSGTTLVLKSRRVDTKNTHGTGCTLSSAITSYLALGEDLAGAVKKGHAFVERAVGFSYSIGAGHGPTNPYLAAQTGKGEMLERLYRAWEILESANPVELIPEVQSNLAEALPYAASWADVAAFPGRIIKCGKKIARAEGPRFGASRHMAKILLACARHQSPFRAVMNVRYGDDVLSALKRLDFTVAGFNRADEPTDVKSREGSTLEWGTSKVLSECTIPPDAIFDIGDFGKEPMIRIFGLDAVDVAQKVAKLSKSL